MNFMLNTCMIARMKWDLDIIKIMREKEEKPDELEVRVLLSGKEYTIKIYKQSDLEIVDIDEAITFLNSLKFNIKF